MQRRLRRMVQLGAGVRSRAGAQALCRAAILGALLAPAWALPAAARAPAGESILAALPLAFEPNRGQAGEGVRFAGRAGCFAVAATGRGLSIHPRCAPRASAFELRFRAEPDPEAWEALAPLPGRSHYYRGTSEHWIRDVPRFARLALREVAPGVDVAVYGVGERLEFDWILAPGASPAAARFHVVGAEVRGPEPGGGLVLAAGDHRFALRPPVVYQEGTEGREPRQAHYRVTENAVQVVLADYDPARTLVIDPILEFSSFLGGTQGDFARGVDGDADGFVYLTGTARNPDFPGVVAPIGSPTATGADLDVYVTKIDTESEPPAIVYSAYLAGLSNDKPVAIAADGTGGVCVTGDTQSSDFPMLNALQAVDGGTDAFALRFDAEGALVYSTFLRGLQEQNGTLFETREGAGGVAADALGNCYYSGSTATPNVTIAENPLGFPVTGGAFQTEGVDGEDAYVVALDSMGNLVFGTLYGGAKNESSVSVALDALGRPAIGGITSSTDLVTTPGSFRAAGPTGNEVIAFVARFDGTGSNLLYGSYLGGSFDPLRPTDLRYDEDGNVLFVGTFFCCSSQGDVFPTTPDAVQAVPQGLRSTAFALLDPAGDGVDDLLYASFLAGPGGSIAEGIDIDAAGNFYVVLRGSDGMSPLEAVDGLGAGGRFVKVDPTGAVRISQPMVEPGGVRVDRAAEIAYLTGNALLGDPIALVGPVDTTNDFDTVVFKITTVPEPLARAAAATALGALAGLRLARRRRHGS